MGDGTHGCANGGGRRGESTRDRDLAEMVQLVRGRQHLALVTVGVQLLRIERAGERDLPLVLEDHQHASLVVAPLAHEAADLLPREPLGADDAHDGDGLRRQQEARLRHPEDEQGGAEQDQRTADSHRQGHRREEEHQGETHGDQGVQLRFQAPATRPDFERSVIRGAGAERADVLDVHPHVDIGRSGPNIEPRAPGSAYSEPCARIVCVSGRRRRRRRRSIRGSR